MMPSNQFLDYLCSMGYAHRLDSVVTVPRPSYPNDKALEPAGTRYFSTITQYTVEFGIAQMDNTKVVIPMYRRASLQPDPNGLTILEKILAFLEYLGRQRGGIPFTSKHGGQGPGYRAQYVENPVGADDILMAMSLFGPPPGTWLDRAWAVEYLRSFLVELRQNEAEYKEKEKEILATPSKIGEYFPNKGEYEAKKKEIFEKYKEGIENKRSSETSFNNDKIVVENVFRLFIAIAEEPYIIESKRVNPTIITKDFGPDFVFNDSDWVLYESDSHRQQILRTRGTYSVGDTTNYYEKRIWSNGRVDSILITK